VKFTTTCAS